MNFILQPWQLLLFVLASWVNRQQQEMIEYLQTENRVRIEKFGKRRILLSDDQRRRLAVKGQILGRKRLEEVGTLFTPDTMMRWHRTLVAKKGDSSDRREKKTWPTEDPPSNCRLDREIFEAKSDLGFRQNSRRARQSWLSDLRYHG